MPRLGASQENKMVNENTYHKADLYNNLVESHRRNVESLSSFLQRLNERSTDSSTRHAVEELFKEELDLLKAASQEYNKIITEELKK